MRVGISVSSIETPEGKSKKHDGIGTYTSNLVKELSELVEIYPVCFKSWKRSLMPPYFPYPNQKNTIVSTNPVINQFSPINFYKNIEKNINIFHSTDYIVPNLSKTPVIATLYDAIMFKTPELTNMRFRKLKNHLLKVLSKNAAHIITISDSVKSDIVNYWEIPEKKITSIHIGLSPIWFERLSEDCCKQTLLRQNIHKSYFLIVGTLQPRKNIARIISAWETLPRDLKNKYMLVFAGNRGWLEDEVFHHILKLESSGNAKWLRHVAFPDLRVLVQSATALVFPSLSEGFGLPILEGFAAQTPVITSNFGATAEIAGNAAYLVDPYQVESIGQAMQQLAENTERRQHFITSGLARAKQFSWRQCAEKTLEVYRRYDG